MNKIKIKIPTVAQTMVHPTIPVPVLSVNHDHMKVVHVMSTLRPGLGGHELIPHRTMKHVINEINVNYNIPLVCQCALTSLHLTRNILNTSHTEISGLGMGNSVGYKFVPGKRLSIEATQILNDPNAGGSSDHSEAYAMQILVDVFGARGVQTEMQIKYYNVWWKKCDFITWLSDSVISDSVISDSVISDSVISDSVISDSVINNNNTLDSVEGNEILNGTNSPTTPVGVSITRAVFIDKHNPDDIDLKVAKLLTKKLSGLVVARAGTQDGSVFSRSILFVWSPSVLISKLLWHTFHYMTDDSLKSDVELIIAEYCDEMALVKDFYGHTPIGNVTLYY